MESCAFKYMQFRFFTKKRMYDKPQQAQLPKSSARKQQSRTTSISAPTTLYMQKHLTNFQLKTNPLTKDSKNYKKNKLEIIYQHYPIIHEYQISFTALFFPYQKNKKIYSKSNIKISLTRTSVQ